MYHTTAAFMALLGLAAAQKVHVVSVSGEDEWALKFSPENIQVPAGDMIQFQFRAGNHSVVQSNFDNPCEPISMHSDATGFFSGYQLVAASQEMDLIPTYTVMVQDDSPMWVYCSQAQHCQNGMVMVVNENTAANSSRSLEEYKKLAAEAPDNLGGDMEVGGEVGTTPEPGDDMAGDDMAGDDMAGDYTPTPGSDATPTVPSDGTASGTDSADGAASSIAQVGGSSMVTVTSPMGFFALAAALFML